MPECEMPLWHYFGFGVAASIYLAGAHPFSTVEDYIAY